MAPAGPQATTRVGAVLCGGPGVWRYPPRVSVAWWKRRHENPLGGKPLLGMFLTVLGVMTLVGSDSVIGRVAGGLVLALGLFLGGDGLWWRTGRQQR